MSAVCMSWPGNLYNSVLRNVAKHLLFYKVPLSTFLSHENVIPYKFLCESTNSLEITFGPMKVIFKELVKNLYSKEREIYVSRLSWFLSFFLSSSSTYSSPSSRMLVLVKKRADFKSSHKCLVNIRPYIVPKKCKTVF
jgi:hypothetical protein